VFLLDSNVYIRAFREPAFGRELQAFHRAYVPKLVLSAVVASGLLRPALRSHLQQRSFSHDILIAASAREMGATIVTLNSADFTR
jgi:predicted nucleic acid-binding protein